MLIKQFNDLVQGNAPLFKSILKELCDMTTERRNGESVGVWVLKEKFQ